MITIRNEITIEVGDLNGQAITLWVVHYGPLPEEDEPDHLPVVLNVLRRSLALHGWLLECENDDTYCNKNANVFSQGFLWPCDEDDEA